MVPAHIVSLCAALSFEGPHGMIVTSKLKGLIKVLDRCLDWFPVQITLELGRHREFPQSV